MNLNMGFNMNMGFGMGNNNNYQLEEQIFNLSIQLLNTGIQAFKDRKKIYRKFKFGLIKLKLFQIKLIFWFQNQNKKYK